MIFKRRAPGRPRRFRRVRGYVPENRFLKNKNQEAMRLCREDLAVVDARAYRILALRQGSVPAGTQVGEEAFYCFRGFDGVDPELLDTATRHSHTHPVSLIDRGRHCLMLYFPALEETGVFLAVDFPNEITDIRRGLWLIGLEDVRLLPTPPQTAMRALRNDRALCERMQELFGYLNGIFDRRLSIGRRLQLASELAGYSHLHLSPALTKPYAGSLQEDRKWFTALLCLFLEKRYEDTESECSLLRTRECLINGRAPRFWSHPAFFGLSERMQEETIEKLLGEASPIVADHILLRR